LETTACWAIICLNTNVHEPVDVSIGEIGALPSSSRLWRVSLLDDFPDSLPVPEQVVFQPAEVIVITAV
jgi:hypothetical protein